MSEFSGLPLLIEPADLAPRLNAEELLLVDLSGTERYAAGHLPGARHVDFRRTQLGQPPAPGLLPSRDALEELFSELGHRPEKTYVVYDDEGGGWAGRFIWLLDVIGHGNYHYLNGGLHAWMDEDRPLTSEVPPLAETEVRLTLQEHPSASLEYLQSRLGAEDVAIWDARSPAEYRGTKVLANKGGHIPGAVNLEWTSAMDIQNGLRIRRDLAQRLEALGITKDKEVITHCQSHHRSGFTYLAARALGYPRLKAYPGSWSEWGNHPDTPVAY